MGWGDLLNMYDVLAGQPKPVPGMRASHLYPSSASAVIFDKALGRNVVQGGCLRQQFLQFLQEPPSDIRTDMETLGSWTLGDMLQDYIEDRFKEGGFFLQSELPVYIKELNLSGRIDTILKVWNPTTNQWKLVGQEVKSKSGYWAETNYINPTRSTTPTDFRPDPKHMYQSMIYLWACLNLPWLKDFGIDTWFITYILRESGDFNWFELKLTDANFQKGPGYPIVYSKLNKTGFVIGSEACVDDIFERYMQLLEMIKIKQLPARDYINAYSVDQLIEFNNAGKLNTTDSKKVAAGQFSQLTQKHGETKEPKGDSECMYCAYRSKCWGLGNFKVEQFKVV